MRTIFRFTFIAILLSLASMAQVTSPVSSTVVLGRPYSLRLSDYVEPGTSRISATLLLASDPADPSVDRVQVRLRLVIENNNLRIATREGFLPSTPLFLTEGVPELLDASDLAPYFDLRNLDFVGLDKAVYQQTNRLPEGFYTFRIEVYEYFRGSKLGGLSPSATAWLTLNDPPRWVWPSSPGQRPTATEPQNLLLQWLPMHTGSPNALSGVSYELTMVELWPREDQDPNEALNSLSPFYKVADIETNALVLGPDAPQLVPGRKYALRLRATEAAGLSLFRNNGYSEVTYFTFGEPCLSPSMPVSRVRSSREAEVSWSPLTNHSGFRVRYREPGQENWYTQSATNASAILSQLNAGRTYEYTIQPQCGTLQGPETPPATFVTPNPTVSGPDCGTSTLGTNLRNSPLRTTLTPGEEYTSGKHVLVVDNYTPSTNGSFRGVGKMRFGFISGLPFAVEFTGLKVGTDNEIKDGDIKTIIYGVYVIDERTLAQAQATLDYASTLLQGTPPSAQSLAKLQDTLRSIRNLPPSVVAAVQQGIQTIAAGNTNAGQKQVSDALKQASTDLARSINKGGNVIGGGGGNRGKELLPLPGLAVTFSPHTDTRYGFDAPGYASIANTYGQENGIPIAWKALESGQSDPLRVTISVSGTRYKRDSVTFGTQNGGKLTLVQNRINPSGGADGSTMEVYALYPTTGGGTRNISQINTVSYDKVVKTVVIVPLGAELPVSSQVLTDSLNRIFGQAVAGFTVEVKPVFKSGWTGTVSIGGTGMLAAYTQSQRDIITEYKNANRDISSTKYYMFVGGTPSDPQVQGYMPRARRFGFIFDRATTAKTLAHELGHGVFHLQHAFDEKQLDRTGDNLMSYGTGTRLHKYQWDKVHNPELVLGVLEDDEDGMAKNQDIVPTIEVNDVIGIRTINESQFVFISPEPKMPELKISVKDNSGKNLKFKVKLIVGYYREVTEGPEMSQTNNFPNSGFYELKGDGSTKWSVDWNNGFYGGIAWLKIYDEKGENTLRTYKFFIRAKNPTLQQVMDYISTKGYNNDYWFFSRIVRHESGSGSNNTNPAKQFNELPNKKEYAENNGYGLPTFGAPNGWGLMQLDNKDEINATISEIWNWKKNIDKAKTILNSKKNITISDLNDEIKTIKKIFDKNPEDITPANDEIEGNFTFIHAPTNISGFTTINSYFGNRVVDLTHKSFIDANIIRRYNGGQYYRASTNKANDKGFWYTTRKRGFDNQSYVELIGNEAE